MARHYDEAIMQLRNILEMDPAYLLAHIILAQCYEQKGQYVLAIAELQQAETLSPDSPPVIAALGQAYDVESNRPEPTKALDRLHTLSLKKYVSPFYMALLYTGLAIMRGRSISSAKPMTIDPTI